MPDINKALQKAVVFSWFGGRGIIMLKGSVLTMDVSAGERGWNVRFLIIALLIHLCLPSGCRSYWGLEESTASLFYF